MKRVIVFTLTVACASADPEPTAGARPSANSSSGGSVTPTPTSPMPPNPAPVEPTVSTDPEAYTLTLYAIAAPKSLLNQSGISWVSPGALVRTTLINEGGSVLAGFTRSIGHAGVEVKCDAYGANAAATFIGSQTTQNSQDLTNKVTVDQIGLGMMIDNVPGRIEPESELRATLDDRVQNGGMSYVRFQISAKTCHGLLAYQRAYVAAGVHTRYGLKARPLYREGAGCSAFSMAFLELANVISPEMRANWSFDVRIPLWTEPLFGPPEPLIGGTMYPTNKIPVARASTLTRGWAKPTEDGVDIFGWDPTMMHTWIDTTAQGTLPAGQRAETKGKARGLIIDQRATQPSAELAAGTFFKN